MKPIDSIINGIDPALVKDALAFDSAHPLLFNTGLFLALFAGFIIIYSLIRRWKYLKLVFVILFSLYFYYKSAAEYCFILLGVCVSDYMLGRLMGFTKKKGWQRVIVAVNILVNVGMLVYFKYFELIWKTICEYNGLKFDALDIILPVGMSFYVFRSISYIVDIYRGHIKPATNFLEYTFYLTFFPPLLAGPVVRARDLLPQIQANPVADRAMVSEGFFLIMAGLIKKVVVADYIGENFVSRIFENPSLYTGFENMLGTLGYVLKIYCDFSGYSDMAIGIALLLGYRFLDNFNSPYKSQNPTEFWKRWHISLSSWLMDYVYIPLGGNRKGKFRRNVNLMTTMLLGGLWHGETLNYLIWGFYNGALLIGHKTLSKRVHLPRRILHTRFVRALNVMLTFVLVGLGFICFAAPDTETIGQVFTSIFTNFHPEIAWQFAEGYTMVVIIILIGFFVHFLPDRFYSGMRNAYAWLPMAVQAVVLAMVVFLVIQTRQSEILPFIYLKY